MIDPYKHQAYFGGNSIKRYRPDAQEVEAALVTESNIDELARWCGGKKDSRQLDYNTNEVCLLVPGIPSAFKVVLGEYLVRLSDGSFKSLMQVAFKEKYPHEVGKRQEGPVYRGTINELPPLENYQEVKIAKLDYSTTRAGIF